uniref:DISC1 scaffold protein n=1 Tax=Canis lupus familiaris TaxID=9615 RepID=A0A8C0PZZ5_CANLF
MLGAGARGAPAGGGGGPRAGSQDCIPPAASFRRRRLARRPGYMRSAAGPRIGFLYPAVAAPFQAQGGACGEESHQSESRAGRCGLDSGGQWRGPSVGSPVPRSTAASAPTSGGYLGLALTPVRRPSGLFGIQLRAGTKPPARPARSCGPGDTGWQGELPSMDSSEAPGPGRDAAGGGTWTKGCLSPEEASGSSYSLGSVPKAPPTPAGSQDAFTSSFSFIRLSLGSAGERGEAEGCLPSREAETPCQSPKEAEVKAASMDRPHEHPRLFSPHFTLKTIPSLADSAQTTGGSHRPECDMLSLLDTDTASSCSPGPWRSEGSSLGEAHLWETLLRRCEPVLLDCLLSDRRQLEVKSLRLKLQKLQEKAIEDDDYDKAEALRHRLEELEKEKNSLHFQLPSRQPALCSLLGHLHAQAQAAVCHGATPLQERIKSLNLSLKEITAKVCMSERLSSTLRKKVNDIETQLPALLEAKMLAVSGNNFSTAKELTEEIRTLTSEREGLEGLLDKLRVLSSRNVQKLGSVKEDYSKLRRELDQGETAYEMNVKENTMKYMEVLEDKLRSCKCPLLGKVWEADLEACQLLIQGLQLQARGILSAEDERQTDDLGGAACTSTPAISPRLHSEVEKKTPLQAFEDWKVQLSPALYFAGSEQKEESCILSAELGEKCEAIDKKLLYLEDQLHTAIHSHDEDLIQSLKRELQMVKETLQAMILQLQPAKEVGEREAAASCVTAGVREAQA